MKILVIFFPGLGNSLLLVPMLKSIRTKERDAEIDVLIKEPIAKEILMQVGLVRRFIKYRPPAKGFGRWVERVKLFNRLRKEQYDIVIQTSQRARIRESIVLALARGREKIGISGNKLHDWVLTKPVLPRVPVHETEWYYRLLFACDISPAALTLPVFSPDEAAIQKAEEQLHGLPKPIIGFHPGCGEALAYKRWPPEKFGELADLLIVRYEAHIVLFGGPGEEPLVNKVQRCITRRSVSSLVGKLKISETAAAIRKCECLVSNDSGLMHLAGAMGKPVVAVFGPSSIVKNRPLGRYHQLVYSRDADCDPESNQMCENCKGMWKNRRQVPRCLEELSVEAVVGAVSTFLRTDYLPDVGGGAAC